MAISIDWNTLTFTVPQADLTLVSGTLYDMETETYFRAQVNAIMASEEGIVYPATPTAGGGHAIDHNTDYTVVGVTYARKIEMINGFSLTFTPNSQWTVRLQGSNNNLFDVANGILNQNQVQVIAQNSAGLIVQPTGQPKKNAALANFEFFMVDSTDHYTGKTGLTITSQRSRDSEAFNATDNTATEVSNGLYRINLTASDMNGDVVTFRFTATGADDRIITIVTAA